MYRSTVGRVYVELDTPRDSHDRWHGWVVLALGLLIAVDIALVCW